ncbi:hypothetical protein OIV83_002435 [Microbotryomycetes sp. JL201]|nr:hypothetical protein OIV83_002435 [Microbotryomycetes sp. JL201]
MSDVSATTAGLSSAVAHDDQLELVRTLLADVQHGVKAVSDSVTAWQEKFNSTTELSYPQGISLLSLKNQLLLSYVHHLVAVFALRLQARSLTSAEGSQVVATLVKLRVVLEKVAPLEQRLKYQIEKLVRKADQADEPQDDDQVANGKFPICLSLGLIFSVKVCSHQDFASFADPLAFRPNPDTLMVDRGGVSDDGRASADEDDDDRPKSGVYRPPRVSAMPYAEGPAKGKKAKRPPTSHLVNDMSIGLSGSTPYGETTTGLSVAVDPALMSGTARHLKQIEDYEMANFTRLRKSKKEARQRRAQEEEVAFGGLGSGKNGRRRLGGFGAEFDDLLGEMDRGRNDAAYDEMKKMKQSAKRARVTTDTASTSGVMDEGSKRKRGKFDKAVNRMNKQKRA